MKLFEFAPTRSIRVRWTLQELGVDFEAVTVDMLHGGLQNPDFVALNPARKLPVLIDGDHVLTESVAIVLYLGEKYLDRGLVPANLAARADLYKWLLFAATELEQPLWRIARHANLYPEDRRLPADIPLAREDFRAMARVAEEHLTSRPYVMGADVSVADFVLAHTLDWANEAHVLDGFPMLLAYIERMYARPRAAMRIAKAMAQVAA
jgi:glutathione S-transferase